MPSLKQPSGKKNQKKNTADDYWKTKQKLEKKGITLFDQVIFRDWCKACGICIAFCPKKVFKRGEDGKPVVDQPDNCIGCLFCELHCPDFAISIKDRFGERRRKTNGS